MNIEWHLEKRLIKDLREYHKNPRKITKDQLEQLKRNIEKFGLIDKPFINLDGVIIGGHQRLKLLKKLGVDEIEVWVPNRELSTREVEELNYRHNENHGSWDYDILANQYDHIDLLSWGNDPLEAESTEKKKSKPRVIFEFDTKEEIEERSEIISQCAMEWGAQLKIKI